MLRFLSDKGPQGRSCSTPSLDFYREEFLKHKRCLERQREYYSERAISRAEAALARILGQLEELCAKQGADELVSRLLRQFDTVTGLSAWSDPKKVH
jgi:histidinol-phosphate/aromatic aminotransferase/cobyric acid decarboxylase-like protein